MSTANGHPAGAGARTSPLADEYRTLRAENRVHAERIRAHRLVAVERHEKRRRDLTESLSVDWVAPYVEALNLLRGTGDPVIGGPTSVWQRKYGKNWPIVQTEQDLAIYRAPARALLATNGYAQGLVEGLTSYVLGSGCTYRVMKTAAGEDLPPEAVEAAQAVVDATLARNEWFGGEQPGIEEELFGRSIEDGEWLLCHYPQESGWCEFRIPEPEQLTQPPGSDVREYGFGIFTHRTDQQKHLKYWLQYGDSPSEGEEYDAEEVTHFRRNVRRGMKRGITDFAFDTYDSLHLAGRLRTNLADTAAQQAAIVYVRQHDNGSQEEVQAFIDADSDFTRTDALTGAQQNIKQTRRGGREDIPKGMSYVPGPVATSTPIHIQVLDACLRGAGCRWNAPPWLMSGDLNAMNYATSLTAESPFVKTVQRRQRNYTQAFRRPIWFALAHRVKTCGLRDKTGKVWSWDEIGHLIELVVTAPSPETRDKLQDAQRAAVEIPLGVQSRQGYMQEQGRDVDQVEADNQEYADKFGQPGQPLPTDPPPDDDGGGAGADTSGLTESLLESLEEAAGRVLLEAGFTGVRTDALGRKTNWVEGKRVAKAAAPPAPKGKPAAKPDPKAAKPKKADPKETAAAVKAQLAGDPSKLTPAKVKDLAAKLDTLNKEQIIAIKKEHDLKGGKTKADHVASLVAKAKELKKRADAAKPKKPKAAPATEKPAEVQVRAPAPKAEPEPEPAPKPTAHPVQSKFATALNFAPDLSDDQRQRFADAAVRVTGSMPKAALDRIDAHLTGVTFHATPQAIGPAVVEALAGAPGLTDAERTEKRAKLAYLLKANIGGAYVNGLRTIHADGDHDYKGETPGRHTVGRAMLAHGVYAHELGHALDGPHREVSRSPEWGAAFKAEIEHGEADIRAGTVPKLSVYGGTTPSEGLAEFSRVVYGSDVPHAQIAQEFPQATAVFKARGWWPTAERTAAGAPMPEVFDERLDIGADGSHADTLKEKPAAAAGAPKEKPAAKPKARPPAEVVADLKSIETESTNTSVRADEFKQRARDAVKGMSLAGLNRVWSGMGRPGKLKGAGAAEELVRAVIANRTALDRSKV